MFHPYEALDAAVEALLVAGFDRSDIHRMASIDRVREKIGDIYVASEELADVPLVPRRPVVLAREAAMIHMLIGSVAGGAAGPGTALAAASSDMAPVTSAVAGLAAAALAGAIAIIVAGQVLRSRLVHGGPRHRMVDSHPFAGTGGYRAADPKR